jgi:hypothetical protein
MNIQAVQYTETATLLREMRLVEWPQIVALATLHIQAWWSARINR